MKHGKFILPKDHIPFLRVAKGGSSCASCKFLTEDKRHCGNKLFVQWYGKSLLPKDIHNWCSDYYEPNPEYLKSGGEVNGVSSLDSVVRINMDNYKPYSNITELRNKSQSYLNSLKSKSFSLEESNPDIKFRIIRAFVNHTTRKAGKTKLIITKQITEILKQGIVISVTDETKGDINTKGVIECVTFIMVDGELFEARFLIKMKVNGQNDLYDLTFNHTLPEKDKTESDRTDA